jgi:hypothetical protein
MLRGIARPRLARLIFNLPVSIQQLLLFLPFPSLSPPPAAMASQASDLFLRGESGKSTRSLLRVVILVTIAAAAVASRLFSVIRFESIIHECESVPVSVVRADRPESRSVVQLPRHKVSRRAWLLPLLGLVR